jgi:hypothetical protein
VEKHGTARQATGDKTVQRRRDERIHIHDIEHLLLLHANNGYANALECYIIVTGLVLFPV